MNLTLSQLAQLRMLLMDHLSLLPDHIAEHCHNHQDKAFFRCHLDMLEPLSKTLLRNTQGHIETNNAALSASIDALVDTLQEFQSLNNGQEKAPITQGADKQ